MSKESQNPASEEQASPENPATPDPVEALKAALATAEAQAAQNRDGYLRSAAELENLRKRTQRDLENAHKFGQERLLADLLPVKDSLEMALASLGDKPEAAALRTGVDMTLRLLVTALERQGVTEIDPARGEAFNHEWHEAMAAQESAEVPDHAVLTTVQKGYQLNGRLLRPARVLVAKAPTVLLGDDTA
ncbi:MAG TPA: nucleotide exchange factor GrpE [Gammaproteobacteria bacterium]|nr:nucleotide exchange factor GrpE [Gammaproteobacteria bacterium]